MELACCFYYSLCDSIRVGYCYNQRSSRCRRRPQISDINLGNKAWRQEYSISWFWAFAGKLSLCYTCSNLHATGLQTQFDDSCSRSAGTGVDFPDMGFGASKLHQGGNLGVLSVYLEPVLC
ncbi:putative homogentisate phytyltransferase 2, chloroplastic [Iris pallida]|uniref:Homogentisate phytyltransferase 2, chloroplastic n=1 Tax=Iris pallida TaxID=29817 RepID=A0AAX6DIE7_IRIPA|nr:putative homogentisate phytyltransferase 2, chloroplastic [Iris pallida]